MRLLFLTETIPFPLDSGGRIKTYHTLRTLAREHAVHCHAFVRDESQRQFQRDLDGLCASLTLHSRPVSRLRELRAMASSYATGKPYLVLRHFDRDVFERLRTACARQPFDAVYCDHLSMFEYGRQLGLPIVLDAHNVEFEIVRRHARTLGFSPIRALAEVEWRKLRRYEQAAYPQCQLIYSVSEIDAQSIRMLGRGVAPVAVVPISVNAGDVERQTPLPSAPELLFVGGLHWPPNADAVTFFIKEIFPEIVKAIPNVHLTVVGRSHESITDRVGHPERITFAGHVRDIESYFSRCRVMVVPLRSGSGMRVKILDALARGVPTVTTSVGCEGIDAEPGKHLLVADTPSAFAAAVLRLLGEEDLAQSMSRGGRLLVMEKYDEAVVGRLTLAGLSSL
jgi:glycosyltransferase involved in cell wall biosynthesis